MIAKAKVEYGMFLKLAKQAQQSKQAKQGAVHTYMYVCTYVCMYVCIRGVTLHYIEV